MSDPQECPNCKEKMKKSSTMTLNNTDSKIVFFACDKVLSKETEETSEIVCFGRGHRLIRN